MGKVRNIDFVIMENDYRKIIFRFYPRSSSCHSFGDEPPKSWKEVYKVYYHYKVISIWKEYDEHTVLFDSNVDECSVIDEIANRIKLIVSGTTIYKGVTKDGDSFSIKLLDNEVYPFGDGVSWIISKRSRQKKYDITMFDSNNIGYRFVLTQDKLKDFGEYLNECCEYMLAHGDPI